MVNSSCVLMSQQDVVVTSHEQYNTHSHNIVLHVTITVTTHEQYNNHSHNIGLHITVSQ